MNVVRFNLDNQENLHDEPGVIIGHTHTEGTVYFDQFHKDRDALAYNMSLSRVMGSSKLITKMNNMGGNN